MHPVFSSPFSVSPSKVHLTEEIASINMRTHLSSVAEENKLSDGSGNVGAWENLLAGAGAIAGTGKKPVCMKAALTLSGRCLVIYNCTKGSYGI